MKILKLLFKYKLFRYVFGITIFVISVFFFSFLSELFPENNILQQVPIFIFAFGIIYLFYVIYKSMPEQEVQKEKGKKGTNPIVWFFKPGKYERKLLAKQKRNAKGRAKTLAKKGKYVSAQKERDYWRK